MNRLKEIRMAKKMSQSQLAKQLGVAQNTVSNWENGNRLIDTETLIRISSLFSISIDYILGNSDEASPLKVIETKTLEKSEIEILFNKLNSLGKEKATEYISDLLENPKYTSEDIAGDTASA